MRLIDADPLYKKTAEWESEALSQLLEINPKENIRDWLIWTRVLQERTAFKHDLSDAPTIDPVKHGRWLPEGKYACRCSNCGRAINNRLAASYKFCPECGAKMDKKEE